MYEVTAFDGFSRWITGMFKTLEAATEFHGEVRSAPGWRAKVWTVETKRFFL